jgi:hypothetical protein
MPGVMGERDAWTLERASWRLSATGVGCIGTSLKILSFRIRASAGEESVLLGAGRVPAATEQQIPPFGRNDKLLKVADTRTRPDLLPPYRMLSLICRDLRLVLECKTDVVEAL